MRFSIIVPVYNVEKYLEECLNSIISQNFNDYEIILVNDGSLDGSANICQQYNLKYIQIKYINKSNGGLSSARNKGILNSTGEYLIFTDSDDFWKGKNILFDLNEIIKNENPDVILHEETRYFTPNDFYYENNAQKLLCKSNNFQEDCLELIYNELYVACAWDKIVKREILINNNLFFPLNRKSEDIEWCAKLLVHINKYSLFKHSFYHYRQTNITSITNNISKSHILDIFQMIKISLETAKKSTSLQQKGIENFLTISYAVLLMNFYRISKNDRKKIKKEIFEWKFLLKEKANYRVDKIIKILKTTNFIFTIIILNIYRIIKNLRKKKKLIKEKIRRNKL
jgi:glycosyltransferase involved in cell wall biosynthesis